MLGELRDRGVFLIDLQEDPLQGDDRKHLADHVPALIERVERLAPEKIILIAAKVHDAAYLPLIGQGFAVAPERIPFPGSGQQKRFEGMFANALSS